MNDRFRPFLLALAVASLAAPDSRAAEPSVTLYVGTYTGANSKGIYAFRFSQATGGVTPVGLVAETPSPSWLVASPSGQFLFAANETDSFDADKSGGVSAFRIDRATGSLTPGKSADLVVLPLPDRDAADPHELILDSAHAVQAVLIRGQWVAGNR